MGLHSHAILQDAYQEYTAVVPPSCGNVLSFDLTVLLMETRRQPKDELYELGLSAANAGHALRVNRKFTNPFEQAFEPIYYDGNAKFFLTLIKAISNVCHPSIQRIFKVPTSMI